MDLSHRLRIVFLEGDQEVAAYSGWTEYDFQMDIREVPYTGTLTLVSPTKGDPGYCALIERMRKNPKMRLMVDGVARATCRVRDLQQTCSRRRPQTLVATTEDVLGQPFRNAIPLDFSIEGKTVGQVARDLLGPFGIALVIDDRANRAAISTRDVSRSLSWGDLTESERAQMIAAEPELARLSEANQDEHQASQAVQDLLYRDGQSRTFAVNRLAETKESRAIHPHPGQKIGDWLVGFLKEHGLLIWSSADGKAILSIPDYTAAADFYLERLLVGGQTWEGTILDGGLTEQPGAQVTRIQCTGRTGETGDDDASAEVVDEELEARGYTQLVIEADASLRDLTAAKRKAETVMREAQMASWVWEGTIAGHGVGLLSPAPNMRCRVRDEAVWLDGACLDETLHIVSVGFSYRRNGPETKVQCIRPGTWTA